jgi:hypothetical protein
MRSPTVAPRSAWDVDAIANDGAAIGNDGAVIAMARRCIANDGATAGYDRLAKWAEVASHCHRRCGPS